MTIAMTGEDGISYSDYFDAALETVYVKEITAPNGYAINKTVYPVHVSAGSSVEVEAVNTSVKGKITVKKQDVDTGDFLPQEMQNWTVLFTGCMRKKISRNQMELEFYTKQEA